MYNVCKSFNTFDVNTTNFQKVVLLQMMQCFPGIF